MLKFLHRGFFAELKPEYEKVNDISVHEFLTLAAILAGLIIFGLYPNSILGMIN